jgi:hypothetical protein
MSDNFFLKFYYDSALIQSLPCKMREDNLSEGIACTYWVSESNTSFGFNKVVVSSFGRDSYWMSFSEVKYVVKNSGPVEVKFNRKNNSLSYILED